MSRYEDFAYLSSDFSWETDEHGLISYISGKNLLGYKWSELLGKKAIDLHPPHFARKLSSPFKTKTDLHDFEILFNQANGDPATLIVSAIPLFDENGVWRGARGICHDVTLDRQRDAELAAAQNRERIISYITGSIREPTNPNESLKSALVAVTTSLAAEGCQIIRMEENGSLTTLTSSSQLPPSISKRLEEGIDNRLIFDQADYRCAAQATKYHRKVNGILIFWGKGESKNWNDDDLFLFERVAELFGIELEHMATQERLERLSTTDPLTGLLNRRTFETLLEEKVFDKDAQASGCGVLAFIDFDNFKLVNDIMGHQIGDQALVKVAEILHDMGESEDFIARFGGDEFAIWFHNITEAEAEQRLQLLLNNNSLLTEYSTSNDRPFGISAGTVTFTKAIDQTPSQLIARADAVMYANKRAKKHQPPSPE